MFLVNSLQQKNCKVSFCVLKVLRNYSVPSTYLTTEHNDQRADKINNDKSKMHPDVVYNSVLVKWYGKSPRYNIWKERRQNEKMMYTAAIEQPLPLTLKYLTEDANAKMNDKVVESEQTEVQKITHFPFDQNYDFYTVDNENIESKEPLIGDAAKEEIHNRYIVMKNTKDWMTAYDNFENDLLDDDNDRELNDWTINYGTPDPRSKISNVPCGGCGALLHCKVSISLFILNLSKCSYQCRKNSLVLALKFQF